MLSAPSYFPLERMGYNALENINDHDEIYTSNILLFSKSTIEKNPQLPELMVKAHAESVKRFYEDKKFAVEAYLRYDKQEITGIEQVYDYKKNLAFERVPYVLDDAVRYMIENATTEALARKMSQFNYRSFIDNNTIDRLIQQGFFEQLFGPEIKQEEERVARLAFR